MPRLPLLLWTQLGGSRWRGWWILTISLVSPLMRAVGSVRDEMSSRLMGNTLPGQLAHYNEKRIANIPDNTGLSTSLLRDTHDARVVLTRMSASAPGSWPMSVHSTHVHATRFTAVKKSHVNRHLPVFTSHNFIELSAAPETMYCDLATSLAQNLPRLSISTHSHTRSTKWYHCVH